MKSENGSPPSEGTGMDWATAYLLGELPESERERLEEKFVVDESVFEELVAAEEDLIDDYVRGKLSDRQRRLFEREFLSTGERMRKLAAARVFIAQIDKQPRTPSRRWLLPRTWVPAAAAASLLCIVGAWWLAHRQEAHPAALPVQVTRSQTPDTQLPAAPERRLTEQHAPVTVAFLLTPGLLRDDERRQPLRMPPGAQQVRLEAPLESTDFRAYRAALRTAEGSDVFAVAEVAPHGGRVAIVVPAVKLKPGDYILSVYAIGDGSTPEPVAEFVFRVAS